VLIVADDGVGFNPKAAHILARESLGLRFMRDRVESAGGVLRIDSRIGNRPGERPLSIWTRSDGMIGFGSCRSRTKRGSNFR